MPLRLAELMSEAGLPPGILNVVNGDKEAVDTLLTDPRVHAIGFVGSSAIAEYIYSTGCANGKRVQCFGGAKNHMIVMPDADMDQAVDALVGAGYGSAGERCMAISVAVPVGGKDRRPAVGKIGAARRGAENRARRRTSRPITDRWSPRRISTRCGTMSISASGKAPSSLSTAADSACRDTKTASFSAVACSTRSSRTCASTRRRFSDPFCRSCAHATTKRPFGFPSEHEYGNGVARSSRATGDAARDFVSRVNVGMVGVNFAIPVPLAYHTFGGWKRSGFGDLNQHGPDAVRFYTKTKTVTSRWPSGTKAGTEFVHSDHALTGVRGSPPRRAGTVTRLQMSGFAG